MNQQELEKIILDNGFEQSPQNPNCVWQYPEWDLPLIENRFRVYCALFLNESDNCLEDCTEIYDFENNEFVFKKHFYVCPVKKELHLLNEEKLMNIINSQKELYNKMVKFVKQIMVDEKINDLEKDFDNVNRNTERTNDKE